MPMRRICCGSCGLTQPNGRCAQSATPPSFMSADSSTSLARAIADGAAGTDPVLQLRADTSLRGPSRPNARPGRIPCKSHEIAPARSGLTISPGSAQDKPAIAIHRIQSPFRLHSSREFRDGGLRQQFLRRPVRNLAVRILGEPPTSRRSSVSVSVSARTAARFPQDLSRLLEAEGARQNVQGQCGG